MNRMGVLLDSFLLAACLFAIVSCAIEVHAAAKDDDADGKNRAARQALVEELLEEGDAKNENDRDFPTDDENEDNENEDYAATDDFGLDGDEEGDSKGQKEGSANYVDSIEELPLDPGNVAANDDT